MREIKTRKQGRGLESLEKAVSTGDRMKRAFLQSKEKASRVTDTQTEAPNEYASGQLQAGFDEVAYDAGQLTASGSRFAFRKGREAIQSRKVKTQEPPEATQPSADTPQAGNGRRVQQEDANRRPKTKDSLPPHNTRKEEPQTIQRLKTIDKHPKQRTTEQGPPKEIDSELPSSERGRQSYRRLVEKKQVQTRKRDTLSRDFSTSPLPDRTHTNTDAYPLPSFDTRRHFPTEQIAPVKTAQRANKGIKSTARSVVGKSVKNTQRTIKTHKRAVKTARVTAKGAAQSAKRAEQAAKATLKATQKAARTANQAARATVKSVTSTVKAILAALKSLIAAIVAGGSVALIGIIIICLIGLLVASCFGIFFSGEDSGTGMTMPTVIREINAEYEARLEEIKTSNTHDTLEMSGSRAVWPDVLAIYSVKTTTDPDDAQEVATMNNGKKAILIDIFWAMNEISYRTETNTSTTIVETEGEDGTIVEEEVETTTTTLYITVIHKTADEIAYEYGFTAEQRSQLVELLSDENRSMWSSVLYGIGIGDGDIVTVALSQIGNVGGDPYWSWYGFNSRVEWCACFVSWCANECGYIDAGVIPKFAGCANGVQWFSDRGLWQNNSYEPRTGDIIFFDWDKDDGGQDGTPDHVGIVERVENGYVYTVEGNSGDSCREKNYAIGYYEILGYGTPAY